MPNIRMSKVIQHLRHAVQRGEGAERTDGQLLEGFVSRREQAALVQAHEAMMRLQRFSLTVDPSRDACPALRSGGVTLLGRQFAGPSWRASSSPCAR